jgi:hypothetical protein
MVRHLPHSRAGRQQKREAPFPLRRVRPVAEAPHLGRVEDRLDPAPHSGSRLGLLLPDRVENLHKEPHIDRSNRQIAQHRIGVGGERVPPLLPVLGVAPSRLVAGDKLFGGFTEGLGFGGFALLCGLGRRSPFEGIFAVANLIFHPPRPLARLGKADRRIGAQAHVALPARDLVAVNPTPPAAGRDPQIEPGPVNSTAGPFARSICSRVNLSEFAIARLVRRMWFLQSFPQMRARLRATARDNVRRCGLSYPSNYWIFATVGDGVKHGYGGWGGIRTHGELAPTPVFKTGALNLSATHPRGPAREDRRAFIACAGAGERCRRARASR